LCGICGIAGNIQHVDRDIFKELLIICQLRGKDATGAFSVGVDNSVGMAKTVGTPDRLFDLKSFDKEVDRYNAKVLVGHCRAKTMGDNTHRNAHPFQHGAITGVHNGTLQSWRTGKNTTGFQVDSDWLYSHIWEVGVEEAISSVSGAWALVYWNASNNTLNFLKNDERPLFFAWSEDRQVMYWASEAWMLNVVSRKKKLYKLENGGTVQALADNELWSFEVAKSGAIFTAKPPKTIEGAKSYANFTTPRHGNSGGKWKEHWKGNNGGSNIARPFQGPVTHLNMTPEKDSTETSTPIATNILQLPSATLTGSNTSTNGSSKGNFQARSTLSLCQSTDKNVSSDGSKQKPERRVSNQQLSKLVDFRSIAGTQYITDCKSGIEYTEEQFKNNTKSICGWCRSPMGPLDAAEFVTPNTVIGKCCSKEVA